LRCSSCNNNFVVGDFIFSAETGNQRYSLKMRHIYFQQIDETLAHVECSVWYDMTSHFVNACDDVDECALCSQPIDCDEQMVRIRIGLLDPNNDIVENHEKFREVYLHPDCATTFIDEDELCWNG
jgi:hypothetical protein